MKRLYPVCLLSFFLAAADLHAESRDGVLFGKQGESYPLMSGKFSKWDEMLLRWEERNGFYKNGCEPGLFSACLFNDLQDLLQQLQRVDSWEQLDKVNAFINQVPFFEDIQIYGVDDYWAVPQEAFDHEAADCEDYAIAKYLALKKLGFTVSNLRVTVVEDETLPASNPYHAVLVVHYKGDEYVLDNRDYYVLNAQKVAHYRPIYSVNEESWWLFED